jgi:hypothetical protein
MILWGAGIVCDLYGLECAEGILRLLANFCAGALFGMYLARKENTK